MLKFFSSLTFLYAFTIAILVIYGLWYYRDFARSALHRKRFPIVFSLVGLACLGFLWINLHAPLKLQTFSNLDHHFIRHSGYRVDKRIILGRSDTVNFDNNSYSEFAFTNQGDDLLVASSYSEEPFYASTGSTYQLVSKVFAAPGHVITFSLGDKTVSIAAEQNEGYRLVIGDITVTAVKPLRKGSSAWNLFRDEPAFMNLYEYSNEQLVNALRNIYLLRNDVSRKNSGELVFFISGKLFTHVKAIRYDGGHIGLRDLSFSKALSPGTAVAWGIGFLDNNKNQYRVEKTENVVTLLNRYPVSYPLGEENRGDWTVHNVSKFLLSDSRDMIAMPGVYKEGFLFSAFEQDSSADFNAVLLNYRKDGGNNPLQLAARSLNTGKPIEIKEQQLILPAKSGEFNWTFRIENTFDWNLGGNSLGAGSWQGLIFGSLALFFLLVLGTSLVTAPGKLSWVWQLLASVTLVLLTTRFFLYWRYKSFPPFEGMDLPSLQQLNSFWNFGIIIIATIVLGLVFGAGVVRRGYKWIAHLTGRRTSKFSIFINAESADKLGRQIESTHLTKKYGSRTVFFGSWLLILLGSCALAFVKNFDAGICRHLAIGLTVAYFIFVYISYRHSPLVRQADASWWNLNTSRSLEIVISNPVKLLLSLSLLGVFVFIDIGFAIVFLNFLLFNEAFLCINYAIAGLSAGSRRNAVFFGSFGAAYLLAFILNLFYAPYIFSALLNLPQTLYFAVYVFVAALISYNLVRLFRYPRRKGWMVGVATSVFIFIAAFFFFPKERIIEKAAMTKYRIDVLTMPASEAVQLAYREGKTYEPVIRAAQNQWFINTLIHEDNNPAADKVGFTLLPHSPQNKGAKYNAQATDLVASRFFLAEHGKWSVLLFVLLLILPTTMLASFYKLYPDFTNRINDRYPIITAGFSVLNYLLMTAMLVILAATGRYIFFGQDLPFGSILSKQSILFPSMLIITAVLLFRSVPAEYYANRRKIIPGSIIFGLLAILLFAVKPTFNKEKEFNVDGLADEMEDLVQLRLQPVLDHFDTAASTRNLSIARKDRLFTDSVQKLLASESFGSGPDFFSREVSNYVRADYSKHLDQGRLLYLDLYSGRPQLAVNENYFRVEPPPHIQQSWKGNIYSDSTVYNIALSFSTSPSVITHRLSGHTNQPHLNLGNGLSLSFKTLVTENIFADLYLINSGRQSYQIKNGSNQQEFHPGDSIKVSNPWRVSISDSARENEMVLVCEPDAFMKNFHVNGGRFYAYPMSQRFVWARNFAESIATEFTVSHETTKNAFLSLDFEVMDSLSHKINTMLRKDTSYKKGAEYGICIADGNGRLIAMADGVKDLSRPDPNNKAGFNKALQGENGIVSQALLRKQIGNINLLRMNPGPGSTLKPIIFSAIASQLKLDWEDLAAEGFDGQLEYFGGEKVAKYDFETNNGRISNLVDYLKYSDNYYHSNVLLLGSYPKQNPDRLLATHFTSRKEGNEKAWPYFFYKNNNYRLNDFEHWPGYISGRVNFGSDSSFASIGLNTNFRIHTRSSNNGFEHFCEPCDSNTYLNSHRRSGFILPEYSLFDQQGSHVDGRIPYDVFANCFRGHVKGSSQVMIPPVKMTEAFGKLVSQSRDYSLTLDPYARTQPFSAFTVDNTIVYNHYLSYMREGVFGGMKEVLKTGTAARLGMMLPKEGRYYYFGKTGTTGDNESKTKSKLMVLVISEKDLSDPGFSFRNNKFYTIYFTMQNGPAKQNEEFQAEIVRLIERSASFRKYMENKKG